MKKFVTILFFCLCINVYGQKLIVKANPFSLLNPAFPTASLAIEARPFKRLGIQVEGGYPVYINPWKWVRKPNLRYSVLRGEVRTYVYQEKKTELYLGLETFRILQKYTASNGYFWKGEEVWRYDKASIRANNWGCVAKFGMHNILGKRWILDSYVGVGVRKNYVKILSTQDIWKPGLYSTIKPSVEQPKLYATANIKLGFIIFGS